MNLESSRSLLIRLFTLAALVLVPPMAIVSFRAMGEFERAMIPEMDKKAAAIGRDVAAQVQRAVGYGIPLDRLEGVDSFFQPVLNANPEIRYLAITDTRGEVLFLAGADASELAPHYGKAASSGEAAERKSAIGPYLDLALPVQVRGDVAGQVHVGFAQSTITHRLFDILYDVLVVMAVSLIVAFEILLFVVFFNVTGPLKLVGQVLDRGRRGDFTQVAGVSSGDEVGRFVRAMNGAARRADEMFRGLMAYVDEVRSAHFDRNAVEKVGEISERVKFLYRFSPSGKPAVLRALQATDIRLPLFLFVFAEELGRSFMPLYARDLAGGTFGLPVEMVMALPIAVFMASIAIASVWAGGVIDRVGSRKVFLLGLAPSVLGFFMTGLAQGPLDLMLWRAVSGVGYALVTMACQNYISRAAGDENRAQGLGVFVSAVLTASICGTAMGGVLAERIGQGATFWVAAGLVLLAGFIVHRLLAEVEGMRADEAAPAPALPKMRLFANWRFAALMLFAAVPAKMALTGFLFFLVPVMLVQSNLTFPEIARVMVLYPLVMAVLSALVARLSDRLGWRAGLVALGGVIGGAGLLAPLALDGIAPLVIAIVALGISHGLSASPQLALVPDICWNQCRTHGQGSLLAVVRTTERVGSTIGPLLAAALIPAFGTTGAMVGLGAVVLGLSAVFALLSRAYGAGPHIETEEEAA